jgi:hypothetical protein
VTKHNKPPASTAATKAAAPAIDPRQIAAKIADQARIRARDRAARLPLLNAIAAERGRPLIAFVTSNRGAIVTQVAPDSIRILREHLATIGKQSGVDLLLVTRGGHTLTPLRLISLFREFAPSIGVLIPYMAHSAGTLIALGADEIVMGAMGELSPVDPSVSNKFNPIEDADDTSTGQLPKPRPRIPISVEDVTSYLNLAKEKAGLDPSGMATAFAALTAHVHPVALGNILRQHTLIRHMARRLLVTHMKPDTDKATIDGIVKALTEKLSAHDYLIAREEAASMGLKVKKPSDQLETALWNMYRAYESQFGIDQAIDFNALLGQDQATYFATDAGVIESTARANTFAVRGVASRKAGEIEFNSDFGAWENV